MQERTIEAAAAYVARHCVPEAHLAEQVGVTPDHLADLAAAGVVPQPTYQVGRLSVTSAIAQVGEPTGEAKGWYGPAVVTWLRRAAVLAESAPRDRLAEALATWLAADLRAALLVRPDAARTYGWSEMFLDDTCDPVPVRAYVDAAWVDWMTGAWAVCLRRFDGHHLTTKEIERQRIAVLAADPAAVDRPALLDAMARLDAVLLPFAPHERGPGTPGRFLDEPARRLGLPWAHSGQPG